MQSMGVPGPYGRMKRSPHSAFYALAVFSTLFWTLRLGVTGQPLDSDKDSIQITPHLRNYVSGPVDGKLSLTKYDTVWLYAGLLPDPDTATGGKKWIRKWVLWGDVDSDNGEDAVCHLQRVYDDGKTTTFICEKAGTYIAYAADVEINPMLVDESAVKFVGTADDLVGILVTRIQIRYFDISGRWIDDMKDFMETKDTIVFGPDKLVQSDPIDIIESDYCYYWNYHMSIKAKVGYVFRESEPVTGTSAYGSYILMELVVWIIEPNAITESERNPANEEDLDFSEYSKLLTRRFHSKGLIPCLRKAHPAVELAEDVIFVEERDSELKTPHWKFQLKIHTDRLISTISDITFTISSRQHVALFHCFVGDLRVFVGVRDFDFIDESQSDRNQVNWQLSRMERIQSEYLKLMIKHIYGHGTVYKGPVWGRAYQPGETRTDALVINNPCITQEFALALGGRLYIVEEFLSDYRKNVIDIYLPGLDQNDAEDSALSEVETELRHKMYLPVTDVAFTPTHIVILMQDSKIFLHSHSIYYKGLAFLTSTKKFRIGALVKRRWCARSGTPKTHNMIVPGFSRNGGIIIIQIYPTEKNVNLWISDYSNTCITKGETIFTKSYDDFHAEVNETCIHKDELVPHSDDKGIKVIPDLEECGDEDEDEDDEKPRADFDDLETYITNDGELVDLEDPHFPQELQNVAVHKTNPNSTFYNLALIYKMDEDGQSGMKLQDVLETHGLELIKNVASTPIQLHSVEFTAVERTFLTCVEFQAKEFAGIGGPSKYDFTMMITTLSATDMAIKIYPTSTKREESLTTQIPFPGVLLVRSNAYMLENVNHSDSAVPYTTKIFAVDTALPAYVIDLGNVFVFSSVESKYARPLAYFSRENIHKILRNIKREDKMDNSIENKLKKEDRLALFQPEGYECSKAACPKPSDQLYDIVVTEQGMVSILKRRLHSKPEHGQSVFIGSVMTLDSLREVCPFSTWDNIFQLATPDGEIVYGKFGIRAFVFFKECTSDDISAYNRDPTFLYESCLVNHHKNDEKPYCVKSNDFGKKCLEWTLVEKIKGGNPGVDDELGYCDRTTGIVDSCVLQGTDGGRIPENFPNHELDYAEMLGVPIYSLLNGNLQMVSEEKVTESSIGDLGIVDSRLEDRICPFSNFEVQYIKFDYAEIGFGTRITTTIAYLGKNVPSEAELIIEYENVPGIVVTVSASISEDADETTITKTIDIKMQLPDVDLHKMRKEKLEHTDFKDETNRAREKSGVFIITLRPTIVNLRCKKEDFYTTIQFNIGCDPFSLIRLVSEASPLVAKKVKEEDDTTATDLDWQYKGDYLEIPRDHVWHSQRDKFRCGDEINEKKCRVPYAYLYKSQVFDLSYRDGLIPKLEQFLTARARPVTGNLVVYDMLGQQLVMNLTQLDAGCYNNGSIPSDVGADKGKTWYTRLVESTESIGKYSKEREDVYRYYSDCFDSSFLPRENPPALKAQFYHLKNETNNNQLIFNEVGPPIRTKNRNQIYIFRAAVINTYYNRFTYCKLMDTFFLVRVVGLPTPRQGLKAEDSLAIIFTLFIFFLIIYFIFYKFYTWKLDIPAIPGSEQVELEDETGPWRPVFGPVESDHMMKRLAVKVHAVAKWRQKALQRVIQKYQADPEHQPEWAKDRIKEGVTRGAKAAKEDEQEPKTEDA